MISEEDRKLIEQSLELRRLIRILEDNESAKRKRERAERIKREAALAGGLPFRDDETQ